MLQAAARELLPAERVAVCFREPIPQVAGVDVYHVPGDPAAGVAPSGVIGGVQLCSSVWNCPVCVAKISERRRVDLSAGVAAWVARGGRVFLVTLTCQHDGDDELRPLLEDLMQASYKLRNGKPWQKFMRRFGVVGTVRALECTHGGSGWHPHIHVLFFVDGSTDVDEFAGVLRARWLHVVGQVGRYASAYGFDCRSSNDEVAMYVAKWGRDPSWTVAHEVAKSASKSARQLGRTPMQLLEAYALGDSAAGELFQTYAAAFKGRRQLEWSRGLRAELLPETIEKSDEEVNEELEAESVFLARLTLDEWRAVVMNDARAELLEVARLGDRVALRALVDGLMALRVVDRHLRMRFIRARGDTG